MLIDRSPVVVLLVWQPTGFLAGWTKRYVNVGWREWRKREGEGSIDDITPIEETGRCDATPNSPRNYTCPTATPPLPLHTPAPYPTTSLPSPPHRPLPTDTTHPHPWREGAARGFEITEVRCKLNVYWRHGQMRQEDYQTEKATGTRTDRRTRQRAQGLTDEQVNGQKDWQTDKSTSKRTDRRTSQRASGLTGRQVNGHKDWQTDKSTSKRTDRQTS